MNTVIDGLMYDVAQLFLWPTLLAISGLFAYSFVVLGGFAMQWLQRRSGRGRPLAIWAAQQPERPCADALEVAAHRMLEAPRIATRVTPLLGLVATMIPMGPALRGLADGNLAQVSQHLTVAFSAVILALIASAITFWVVAVRRRWIAEELVALSRPDAASAESAAAAAARAAQRLVEQPA
jgi:biopolymer transport protein ExbB/TolQ